MEMDASGYQGIKTLSQIEEMMKMRMRMRMRMEGYLGCKHQTHL